MDDEQRQQQRRSTTGDVRGPAIAADTPQSRLMAAGDHHGEHQSDEDGPLERMFGCPSSNDLANVMPHRSGDQMPSRGSRPLHAVLRANNSATCIRMCSRKDRRCAASPCTDLYSRADKSRDVFVSNKISNAAAGKLAATQRPARAQAFGEPSGTPAWKTIPSWYLVARDDHAIPAAERFMASRAHAHTTEIDAPRGTRVHTGQGPDAPGRAQHRVPVLDRLAAHLAVAGRGGAPARPPAALHEPRRPFRPTHRRDSPRHSSARSTRSPSPTAPSAGGRFRRSSPTAARTRSFVRRPADDSPGDQPGVPHHQDPPSEPAAPRGERRPSRHRVRRRTGHSHDHLPG